MPRLKFRCGDIAFRFKADINHYLITIDIYDNTFNNLSVRKRLYRIIIRFLKRFRTHRFRQLFRCSRCLFRRGIIGKRCCFFSISITRDYFCRLFRRGIIGKRCCFFSISITRDYFCRLFRRCIIGERCCFLRISITRDYFYRLFGGSLISLLRISIASRHLLFTTRDFFLTLNACIGC